MPPSTAAPAPSTPRSQPDVRKTQGFPPSSSQVGQTTLSAMANYNDVMRSEVLDRVRAAHLVLSAAAAERLGQTEAINGAAQLLVSIELLLDEGDGDPL